MLRHTLLTAGLALLAATAGAVPAQEPDAVPAAGVLRLGALLDTIAVANPRLRAAASAAGAVAAGVPEASTLPDPMVQIGVMNVGLPDLDTDMPASMAPAVQLMQSVPFPGKLGLRGEMAAAEGRMADADALEAWWEVRGRAADVFYDLYSLDGRLTVMWETLGLLESFRTVAQARYATGDGPQTDVLRADVEVIRMEGEVRKLEALRTAAAARLNGLMDRPAATPVPTPVLDSLPQTVPAADTLAAWAWQSRPLLDRGRIAVERAGAGVDLARRQIWPDFTVGLSYGQRDRGQGTERMGSAMVGFSIPVHAGRRQFAERERAEAMRRVAEADLSGIRAEVAADIGVLLAEFETARALVALYRHDILPEARAVVTSALSAYRVGTVDFMTLVEAELAVNRFESELVELLAGYGRAIAGLESSIGRPLPLSRALSTAPSEIR